MLKSFIPKKMKVLFFLLAFVLFLAGLTSGYIIVLGVYFLLYFYFRKKESLFLENGKNSKTIIYSPISGKVLEINKEFNHPFLGEDFVQLRLVLPFWNELGIMAPFSSEVKNLKRIGGESLFRWGKSELPIAVNGNIDFAYDNKFYSFEDKKGKEIGIEFVKCKLGFRAKIWVLPGDRVKARAHMGYFPFGGTVFLYLPKYFVILVNKNESLVSGETIIAGIPDQSC